MNRATLRYGLRSAALTIMSSLMSYCALADSTVTASREYVNRKFDAALGYVDAAMEDQWTATTNVISSSSASATNYIDSATNDVLVAAQGYTDEKISSSSASATNYVDSATNDVLVAAQGYTDEKISEIPPPDFSTNNVELVETIEATAPPPGDYAAVSNAAVYAAITNALQDAALTNKLDKSGGTVAGSDDDPMGIVLGRIDGYPSMIVTDGTSSIGFSGATMSIVTQNGDFSLPLSSGNLARAADNSTEGNLAALDAFGNLTDSGLSKDDVESLFFAQYYPEGNVKSAAEFTPEIKYDDPDTTNRTIMVKPFCHTGTETNDNSALVGRVVIPPFVDAGGNGYISDDGTRYKVVGVSGGTPNGGTDNLTAIVTPATVTTIGSFAFCACSMLTSVSLPAAESFGIHALYNCTSLVSVSLPSATTIGNFTFGLCAAMTSVSLPSATDIGSHAFRGCTTLASVSLPAATTIEGNAFYGCTSLNSVSLPAATTIEDSAFYNCTSLNSVSLPAATNIGINAFCNCPSLTSVSLPAATTIGGSAFRYCMLASVDFGDTPRSSVPSLGAYAFNSVPTACKIIVPDSQYTDWTAQRLPGETDNPWYALVTAGYKFLRHSEWEYARKYELDGKLDKMRLVAWSELKTLRDGGNLVPGQQYRITNYVATAQVDWEGARSVNHPFDIIVIADSITNLNEHARAAVHDGDTYFASSNLEAWDVRYCLDNDKSRFQWADETNGKGVIYRLVDEWQNDVPYDFKGIQFIAYQNDDGEDDVFRYTFDSGDDVDNFDCSIAPNSDLGAMENKIGPYREGSRVLQLNYIVFKGGYCMANTIENDCGGITFGSNSMYNVIGRYSYNIEFGGDCMYNTLAQLANDCSFGGRCSYNSLGPYCLGIRLGAKCESNVFGARCQNIGFDDGCTGNSIGDTCKNIYGREDCHNNVFGNGSMHVYIGNSSNNNYFGAGVSAIVFGSGANAVSNYYCNISVEAGNCQINLVCTTNVTAAAPYRNVVIRRGVNNTSTSKTIEDPNGNQTFETVYRAAGSLDVEVQ